MSNKNFNITKGIFVIPTIGRVDTRKEVSDVTALKMFRVKRKSFPWITLKPEGLKLLKKQKYAADEVAKLIQNASSVEEVELLSELSDTKTVERIKEVKLNGFKANQPKQK